VSADDLSLGLEELARLINWHVGVWHDLGYENPPTPECKPIPPLGERSAEAIKGAHAAIDDIDTLTLQLSALRQHLVSELRQNEDLLMSRLDAKYGPLPQEHHRDMRSEGSGRVERRRTDPDAPSCGCPVDNGLVRHARQTCTDPVVARLGWYFDDGQELQS
jgi:hypothetical protein